MQNPSSGPFPGTNQKLIRPTLRWTPTDRLTSTLVTSFDRTYDYANAWNYIPYACANGTGTTQTNPNVRCAQQFVTYQPDAPTGFGGGVPGSRGDGQPFDQYNSAAATETIAYKLDDLTITSITNDNWNRNQWGLGYNIESPTSFTASHEDTSYYSFSNENRLQTTFSDPINGMVGTYYQLTRREYEQDGAFAAVTDSAAPPGDEFLSYDKVSKSHGQTLSPFFQVTWKIVPEVELAGGARYTHETYDSFLDQPYINPALRSLFIQYDPANPNSVVRSNQSFNNWSPEGTITYTPTQDITIYGGYKTGYKSGGFSNSAFVIAGEPPADISFNPETVRGYEAGIKTELFDRQLRFNIDAYTYKYSNLQVDYFNSINFQFITTNAGAATTKGIETQLEYAPHAMPGLDLHGSLNYNKARYEDYIAPCYGGETVALGCNTYFNPNGQAPPPPGTAFTGQDLSGKPTAVAPSWTASFGVLYETEIARSLRGAVSVDSRYSSSYLGSSFGEPLSLQKQYATIDASLQLRTNDGHWEGSVIGRNLTNNFHINGVLDAPNSGSGTGTTHGVSADILGIIDLPRTVLLQLTRRY
jgi:iron complex outermembrane recepter protein